jgi:predicted lipoprotein with Yx(FWY)xxD motif
MTPVETIRRTRRELKLAAAAAAVVAGVVVALVLTRSGGHGVAASGPARLGDESLVRVAHTRLGAILVDGRSRTLYLYTPDKHRRSVCYDGCSRIWPPALVNRPPHAAPGVTAADLGTTRRRDHRLQLSYHGHPLYRVVTDKRPGQLTGQGYDGVWFVVAPSGSRVVKGAAETSPASY